MSVAAFVRRIYLPEDYLGSQCHQVKLEMTRTYIDARKSRFVHGVGSQCQVQFTTTRSWFIL
jgi:hypothetical protein